MGRLGSAVVASVLAVAAAGSTATMAFAADLPAPAATPSYYSPPPPAHYNWTGIYFGGHVGAGLLQDVVTATTTTTIENAGTVTNVSPTALIGGPQAGFNLEFAPFVIGAEATWTSSAITGNHAIPAIPLNTQEESRTEAHWYATATGKIGFAANDWLFYAKGGAAWMRADYTQITLVGGVVSVAPQLITDTRHGYTIGGGIEYGFTEELSGKLEYDYLAFGTQNYNFTTITAAGLPTSIKSDTHMLLLGLNYRFNFGGGFARF